MMRALSCLYNIQFPSPCKMGWGGRTIQISLTLLYSSSEAISTALKHPKRHVLKNPTGTVCILHTAAREPLYVPVTVFCTLSGLTQRHEDCQVNC